jgi:DNA-binding response OmpR family regulator
MTKNLYRTGKFLLRSYLLSARRTAMVEIRTVLVVEDCPLQREMIRDFCSKLGFETVGFSTAEAAIPYLMSLTEYYCIISDMELPNMSGIQLGRLIRSQRPNVLLIGMSSDPTYAIKALAVGFDTFFTKPIAENLLERCLSVKISSD